jgi:hypothetical protein
MWKNKYDKKDPKNHHFEWLFSKKIASVRKFATKKKQCFQQKTPKKDKILSFSSLKET